jgi:toxin ParE1/3/4
LAYRVDIAAAALRDAREYHRFILKRSHDALPADTWYLGLMETVYSLETLPGRCPHIPEQEVFRTHLHQLLYASHRIIFRIEPKVVRVVRIYHSALRPLTSLNQRPRLKHSM